MPKKRKGTPTKQPVRQNLKTQVLSFTKELAFVLVTVLLINSFVLASFEVPTPSMEDTVMVGDRLLVNKFIYGGSTPYTIPLTSIRIPHFRVPGIRTVKRGDVIVFDWPGERDQTEKPVQAWYLKRCIGLSGDTVQIVKRVVHVNGEKLDNPPLARFARKISAPVGLPNPHIFPRGARFNEDSYGPVLVPGKGTRIRLNKQNIVAWEVFIRREDHTVGIEGNTIRIDGKEAAEYVVERDYVFAMGDNRDISLDSRFWGFVPLEDVIGTPMIVFWSWNPAIPFYRIIDKIKSIDLGRVGTIIR